MCVMFFALKFEFKIKLDQHYFRDVSFMVNSFFMVQPTRITKSNSSAASEPWEQSSVHFCTAWS